MTIALIAKSNIDLNQIRIRLSEEGAGDLVCDGAEAIIDGSCMYDRADLVFLISAEHDLQSAGELTSQIRTKLVAGATLVVCMLRSTYPHVFIDDLGADDLICPAALTTEKIVERILGHLIHEKRITPYRYELLLGATRTMQQLYREIEDCASSTEPVLIRGESGTGKELVAQALAVRSQRDGEWRPVNCAEFSAELIQSELFGHVKGAFTGAGRDRIGLIESAKEGTVFLDEIAELEKPLQAKLLRVIDQNQVRPLGSNDYKPIKARFIFASCQNLESLIADGEFRHDLFQRINVLVIKTPSLVEHLADIPLLVAHLLELSQTALKVQTGALDILFRHPWTGNVRELRNVVLRAAAHASGGVLTESLMSGALGPSKKDEISDPARSPNTVTVDPNTETWPATRARAEGAYFKLLVEAADGSIEKAEQLSGVRKSTVYDTLKAHGLELNQKRPGLPKNDHG